MEVTNKNNLSSITTKDQLGLNKTFLQIVDMTGVVSGPGLTYFFRNSPDDQIRALPSRSSVTQTKGGFWIEDFGLGSGEIKITGNTGFRKMSLNNKTQDGRENFEELLGIYQKYNSLRRSRYQESGSDIRSIIMLLYSGVDDTALVVHPTNFIIKKSKSQPLLYSYDITFIVLGPYEEYFVSHAGALAFANNTGEALMSTIQDADLRKTLVLKSLDSGMTSIIASGNTLTPELSDVLKKLPGFKKYLVSKDGNLTKSFLYSEDPSGALKGEAEEMSLEAQAAMPWIFPKALVDTYNNTNYSTLNDGQLNWLLVENIKTVANSKLSFPSVAQAPVTDATQWNERTVAKLCTDIGAAIQSSVADIRQGTTSTVNGVLDPAFQVVRTARQLQCCVASLIKYPELFAKSLESKLSDILTENSGCATTLGAR